jgi:hypothetical protein
MPVTGRQPSLLVGAVVASVLFASACSLPPGDYHLSLTTDRADYSSADRVNITARLVYTGAQAIITKSSLKPGPVVIGIRQLDGPFTLDPDWLLQCMQFDLARGQAMEVTYATVLQPGHYLVYAKLDLGPNGEHCQNEVTAQASREITVH